jgi:hypothetical protein
MEQKIFAESTIHQYHSILQPIRKYPVGNFLALQKGHKLSEDHVTIGIRNYL